MEKIEIGRVLKETRVRNGCTQAEIARRLGVQQSTVSAWELGVSEPSLRTIYAWAAAVGETAELVIRPHTRQERSSSVVPLVNSPNEADQARIFRIAQALPHLRERTADVLTAAFEGAAEDGRS